MTPLILLPPCSSRSGALQAEGNFLYHKASCDIMEKAESRAGVGEDSRKKGPLLLSASSAIFSKTDFQLELVFARYSICAFPVLDVMKILHKVHSIVSS